MNTIIQGDCLESLKKLEDNSIDAIVTDPPYGLSFMGKRWDYDVPSVEIWEECLRVLKPGGYLLSFAGTRTQHRMAVRIEDAGFEIRDMIAWVYGSGFPKSLNIGKAVDKLQGNEREVVGEKLSPDGIPYSQRQPNDWEIAGFNGEVRPKNTLNTKGTSEWEGWGTALKPAVEPVSVCSKPLQVEHIFAILIDDIWKQLNVLGVTNNLQDTQVKLNEVVNSVHENARTSVLENTNNAELVRQVIMSLQTKSEEEKENSVLENVAQNGEKLYQEIKTQLGEEVEANLMDISISAQMGDISENTALLWKNISEEILNQANKLTTRTALKLITDLKTLRLFLLQNTFSNTGLSKKIQPNLEPITVARKPIEGTVAENCLKWGVGGINIDESRVAANWKEERPESWFNSGKSKSGEPTYDGNLKSLTNSTVGERLNDMGRFPANLIHDGSEEVVECFPESKSSNAVRKNKVKTGLNGIYNEYEAQDSFGFNDSGNASRFFYCAKASKSERNKGCEELPIKSAGGLQGRADGSLGGEPVTAHNNHPTVKPIALMEYLVKLVSKEGHTVLDPFAGSGSTLIACKKLKRNYIGMELDPEYIKIAEARLNSIKEENTLF